MKKIKLLNCKATCLPNFLESFTPKRSAMLLPSASSIVGCNFMEIPLWNPEQSKMGRSPSPTYIFLFFCYHPLGSYFLLCPTVNKSKKSFKIIPGLSKECKSRDILCYRWQQQCHCIRPHRNHQEWLIRCSGLCLELWRKDL